MTAYYDARRSRTRRGRRSNRVNAPVWAEFGAPAPGAIILTLPGVSAFDANLARSQRLLDENRREYSPLAGRSGHPRVL